MSDLSPDKLNEIWRLIEGAPEPGSLSFWRWCRSNRAELERIKQRLDRRLAAAVYDHFCSAHETES